MLKFVETTFADSSQTLDGIHFEDCYFVRCRLIYSGGLPPVLVRNRFENCSWSLEGPAANTIAFLSAIYAYGAKNLVESIFEDIRTTQSSEEEPNDG